MFRDDFNKLVAYFDDFENQEKCKIHTRINTKNYPFGIARFSNDEFKYIDTQGLNEFQLGVFIDLYPLDNYSNNPKTAKKMMKKIRMQNSLYEWYINPFSTNFLKRISKKIVSSFFHFRYGEKYAKIVEKKINKYLNKYSSPNDAYVGIPSWTFALTPQKFDKTLFNDRVLLEFEDDKFYCPVGYCKILEICYGNYMQLPKEEDRVQYHNYKIIRRDNSI